MSKLSELLKRVQANSLARIVSLAGCASLAFLLLACSERSKRKKAPAVYRDFLFPHHGRDLRGRLGPKGRKDLPGRLAPKDRKGRLVLQDRLDPQVLLDRPDLKALLVSLVLWVLKGRSDPLGLQGPRGRRGLQVLQPQMVLPDEQDRPVLLGLLALRALLVLRDQLVLGDLLVLPHGLLDPQPIQRLLTFVLLRSLRPIQKCPGGPESKKSRQLPVHARRPKISPVEEARRV
jgi:hypothetical protein